jgi:hypothetical protein
MIPGTTFYGMGVASQLGLAQPSHAMWKRTFFRTRAKVKTEDKLIKSKEVLLNLK